MCCFTGPVEHVSDTSLFARAAPGGRQTLVYEMTYAAESELAMVLPLPVPPGSPEEALRFISFEGCADFFAGLRRGFRDQEEVRAGAMLESVDTAQRTLEVHSVGAFDASFVPSPGDFGRLDERFRLPVPIWLELRHYRDWGFAVFKLKETETAQAHPMAFEFPTRDPSKLFFPTLHLHDRRLDAHARFDHALYCQPEPAMNWHLHDWRESDGPIGRYVECESARGLLAREYPYWRVLVEGMRENRDTWLGKGEKLPAAAS